MAPPGTVCAQVRSASASPSARGRTVWPAQASARDALQAVSDAALRSVTYPARLGSAEAQRRGTHTARGLRGRGGGSRGGASTRVRRDGARGLSVRTHASRESPQRSVRVRASDPRGCSARAAGGAAPGAGRRLPLGPTSRGPCEPWRTPSWTAQTALGRRGVARRFLTRAHGPKTPRTLYVEAAHASGAPSGGLPRVWALPAGRRPDGAGERTRRPAELPACLAPQCLSSVELGC